MRAIHPAFVLFLLSSLAAAAGRLPGSFVLEDEPSADEAAFTSRYGMGQACDLVALASLAERRLSLPVQALKAGAQRVPLRYVETGWPLGFPAVDGQRPARLGPKPEDWFKNVPPGGRGKRSYGVLRLGPELAGANRFALVLEGDPASWKNAKLWVARKGDGDFAGAVPLKYAGSGKGSLFATLAVLHLAYPDGRRHPVVLWVFTDPKGEALRYYPVAHWRAAVALPSGQKALMALYDFKGAGDYSQNPLALSDGSRSSAPASLEEASGDVDWKPQILLPAGRAVRMPREILRVKALSPMGDWADVEITPR